MSKRITKEMADDAAEELSEIAYGNKLESAISKNKDFVDSLIQKYVPKAVLACAKEYPRYFHKSSHFDMNLENSSSYSNTLCQDCNYDEGSYAINYYQGYTPISKEDHHKAYKLEIAVKELRKAKSDYEYKVSNALRMLQTEKRVKEQFPEALPYLNFTDSTALSLNLNNLRDLLKTV